LSGLQRLRDEEALLVASLADAKGELEAGELSSDGYERIVARDSEELARVREKIAQWKESAPKARSPRRRRAGLLVLAIGCFAVVIAALLYATLSPRQAGQQITGGLSLSNQQKISQLLNEAQSDVASNNFNAALSAYHDVLTLSPTNVQALTQTGWLDFSAGSAAHNQKVVQAGVDDLQKAIELSPHSPAPRLYYAIVAYSTPGYTAVAKNQFEEFLASKPSLAQIAIAKPFLKKLGIAS